METDRGQCSGSGQLRILLEDIIGFWSQQEHNIYDATLREPVSVNLRDI